MSDSEDDFVTYGTALDPLDEDNLPRKKPIAIEEQCAYDAQGRRRFHGAFTGGFSAGYFNTVGTRDGWKPQQFKSTRSSKASSLTQRPEDFMDDEDIGEFGIAPTAIRATQGYSDQGNNKGMKRERAKHDSTGPIPGTPVLHELLKPIKERVGVMLLKKMGWKPGQGVGPRLTKTEKKQVQKQREKIKVYGCSLPIQQEKDIDSESEGSDDEFANITFAPDDYEPFRCNPKDNYFGIGYSGLDRRPVLSGHINLFDAPAFSVTDKNKKLSIRGQAFGVGAFEAEDEDIYAREDISRYDFTLGPERKTKSRWSKEEKPKNCIEGFVPAKEQFPQKKVFPAPTLPRDFQPVHKIRKSRFEPLPEDPKDQRKRTEMNAETRAKIIADDCPSMSNSNTVETKTRSVAANMITRSLNLLGKEQIAERERLEKAQPKKTAMSWLDKLSSTAFVKGETLGTDPKIQGSLQSADTFAAKSEKGEIIPAGIGGVKSLSRPSFADLDKQCRFEQYLKFSESERKLKFPSCQPLSMDDWERDREIEEFEKAVKICEKLDNEEIKENEKLLEKQDKKIDIEHLTGDEKMMAAAKMKMFGKLTRIDDEWRPAKIVCVRFNIAEPDVGVAIEEKKKKKFSIFNDMSWNEMSKFETGQKLEYDVPGTVASSSSSFNESCKKVENTSSQEIKDAAKSEKDKSFEDAYDQIFGKSLTSSNTPQVKSIETKADSDSKKQEEAPTARMNPQEKKDLFKSIFLDSEESESESEETEEQLNINEEKVKAALLGNSVAERNSQRNTSPPRGIFAKLDFDSLINRPEKSDKKIEEKSDDKKDLSTSNEGEKESEVDGTEDNNLPNDMYGPALPKAPLLQPNDVLSQRPIFTGSKKIKETEEVVWVEKSAKKKSKKEKKKHKHKERSRSKSRKKSKKEKKH